MKTEKPYYGKGMCGEVTFVPNREGTLFANTDKNSFKIIVGGGKKDEFQIWYISIVPSAYKNTSVYTP